MQSKRFTITIPAPNAQSLHEASLAVYVWDNSKELYDGLCRPLILVCPGGGYKRTSDREADTIAFQFFAMGFHAAVLRYSVAPAAYPIALLQLASAVRLCRERSREWYVDEHKIVVLGSSAGGHLAACLACFWNEGTLARLLSTDAALIRPNAQILCYPVITSGAFAHAGSFESLLGQNANRALREKLSLEKQVNAHTPPAFIWGSYPDDCVPIENSLLYVEALRKHNITTEFHLFACGEHGIGTASKVSMSRDGRGVQKECAVWIDLARAWIENLQTY